MVAPTASGGRTVVPIGYENPGAGTCTGMLPRYTPIMPTLADRPNAIEAPA